MAKTSALALVAMSLAMGIAPDTVVQPSAWAATNLVVADGPRAGEKWDASLTPQLVEILDCLAPDHPCNRVSVRKSHQVGYTGIGIAWVGNIIANTPGKALVVFPTVDGAREFNAEKLHPSLEESPALKRRVLETRSRSARASTSLKKRFPGGSVTLTGANSTADLRSKTVRYVLADEIDEWPLDLNGQGDPMEMVDGRQTAFHATGQYKKLEGSTPTIKGASRIDAGFEDGDQRYWQVPCPHCGEHQKLVFKNLHFAKEYPFNAHYVCAHCGCVIEHHQKEAMVLAGKWVAENPGPGRHPSYHLDTLTSLLTTWDKLAEKWVAAQGKPEKLKAFVNLWLGESWEERGEAPEWQRLFATREDYDARRFPPGAVVYTCGCDVQANGIYYEVVGWGKDKQSWSVDVGFLPGDTADPDSDAWALLDRVYERRYPNAHGGSFPVDVLLIDSGYNTNQVYLWVRKRHRAYAIKGEDGWAKASISKSPTAVDINWKGKKVRRGAALWHVGTWPLKAEFYAQLRKEGRREGQEQDPPGFCHFSEGVHDESYFKQVTAEYLKDTPWRGRTIKAWYASGPNHFLDCRVYNMAAAALKGVGIMTDAEWASWEAARLRPPKPEQGSLLAMMDDPASLADDESDMEPQPQRKARHHRRPRRGGGFVHNWKV